MMNKIRTSVLVAFAVPVFVSLGGVGCAVASPEAGVRDQSENENADSARQAGLADIDLCSETGVAAHATINQVDVYHTSPNDQYTYGIGCKGYIVEYTDATDANLQNFSGGWYHTATSQAECERLRASYSFYSYNAGAWTANGTATFHGNWVTGPFGGCYQEKDSGATLPHFTAGTKWRVRVAGWERNCVNGSCSNDYKRVFAWLSEPPQ